jgi:hypothetical protein
VPANCDHTAFCYGRTRKVYKKETGGMPIFRMNAGLAYAIEQGWIEMYESGTYFRFTPFGNDLFSSSA